MYDHRLQPKNELVLTLEDQAFKTLEKFEDHRRQMLVGGRTLTKKS